MDGETKDIQPEVEPEPEPESVPEPEAATSESATPIKVSATQEPAEMLNIFPDEGVNLTPGGDINVFPDKLDLF